MIEPLIISLIAGGGAGGIAFFLAKTTLTARLQREISQEYSRKVEEHVGRLESDLRYLIEQRKGDLANDPHTRQERWTIKRKACLQALKVVDAYYSNLDWEQPVERQLPPNIAVARDCYNQLALCCQDQAVLDAYKRCLGFYGPIREDFVLELRNAIRNELGLETPAESDREHVWLNRLTPQRSLAEELEAGEDDEDEETESSAESHVQEPLGPGKEGAQETTQEETEQSPGASHT